MCCAVSSPLQKFLPFAVDQRSAILTTVGVLEQPLGSARLHVARLVASLLQTCDLSICQEICRLNIMDLLLVNQTHIHKVLPTRHYGPTVGVGLCTILFTISFFLGLQDLFFKYTWNNFLHLQVELCVASIMNHSAHTDLQNPGLQNHEERAIAGAGSPVEEETPGQNSNSDPETTPVQDALVSNVGFMVIV